MIKKILILFCIIFLSSCKSTKTVQTKVDRKKQPKTERVVITDKETSTPKTVNKVSTAKSVELDERVEKIIKDAKRYEGTRYKYGGTTKKGMDCSGLVVTCFEAENIKLPRTTSELSVTGDWIDLKEVQKGDLVFFATRKNSRTVNHVGIVTESRVGYVEFIHASTSAGVIVSSLSEKYWYFAFVQARRIL